MFSFSSDFETRNNNNNNNYNNSTVASEYSAIDGRCLPNGLYTKAITFSGLGEGEIVVKMSVGRNRFLAFSELFRNFSGLFK